VVVPLPVASAAATPLVQAPSTPRPVIELLPRWVAPAPKRRLDPGAPIRLRWRAKPGSTFYNVQVFAGSRKLLSLWPTVPSLTVRLGVLRSGSDRIVVWSASGSKRAPKYDRKPWVVHVLRIGPARPLEI
jgi:hypothetical protein